MEVFNINGELNQDAVDVLYELGNVGTGTAIMAIGSIREMQIKISTSTVFTVKDNIFDEIGYNPDQIVIGICTHLDRTLQGSLMFLLSREFVHNTLEKMTEETFTDEELLTNEDCISALSEMINYMTAGYAKVIGHYLQLPIYISQPSVGLNKASTLVSEVISNMSGTVKKAACVNTKFKIVDEDGKETDETGQVLIFPHEKCIEKFVEIMTDC